jgi:DNA anti-recombination protein RmuC
MSKEEIIERLQEENAQLRAEVTALKNVVNGMNSFLSEVEE